MDDYDRRHFIKTSLPGLLGITMALPSLTALATKANAYQGRIKQNGAINWDAFLSAIEKEAKKQHLDSWNEDKYVAQAAKIANRLNLKDPHLKKAFARTKKRGVGNRRIDFAPLEKQISYHVTLVQFEKKEIILPHDHPEMTGILLCATGNVEVKNYDFIKQRKNKKEVILDQTGKAILSKGKLSSLTSKQRNIHTLVANDFTQLIDIFAPPYNKERIRKSSWYEIDPDPIKRNGSRYYATKK